MIEGKRSGFHYNKALDGVRGLAILLVIMSHAGIFHFGWTGVQLFFVLSGFLITSILLKEKEKPIATKQKFRNFWARRILRIFPLYFLYLLFLVILWSVSGEWKTQSGILPWLITYTVNFSPEFHGGSPHYLVSHLWTLSIEEQFYLLFPFLVLLCNRRVLKIVVIGVILFSISYRFICGMSGASAGFIYTSTFSHLDAFLLGGTIVVFNLEKWNAVRKYGILVCLFVIFLFAGICVYLRINQNQFDFNNFITHLGYTPDFMSMQYQVWSYTLLNLLFASLLLVLISPGNSWMDRLLAGSFRFAPLVAIGKVSYGIYIIHRLIQHLVREVANQQNLYNKYLVFLIDLVILYGVAYILYRLYEKRFLTLKEKFR